MWRDGIEQQFDLSVTRETRPREVWVARSIGHGGPMLRYYGEAKPGIGFGMANFNLVMNRPHDAPLFPLEPFAVHSVPFFYLANVVRGVPRRAGDRRDGVARTSTASSSPAPWPTATS